MRLRHERGGGGACDQSSPAVCHGCSRLWWRAMGGIRGWRIYDRPARPPRPAGPLETLPQPTQSRCDTDRDVQDRTGDRRFVCERVGRIRLAPSAVAPLSSGFCWPVTLNHRVAVHVAERFLASTRPKACVLPRVRCACARQQCAQDPLHCSRWGPRRRPPARGWPAHLCRVQVILGCAWRRRCPTIRSGSSCWPTAAARSDGLRRAHAVRDGRDRLK